MHDVGSKMSVRVCVADRTAAVLSARTEHAPMGVRLELWKPAEGNVTVVHADTLACALAVASSCSRLEGCAGGLPANNIDSWMHSHL